MRAEPTKTNKRPLTNRRLIAEQVVMRAEYLAPADKALLQAVFERGITAGEFARAIGKRPQTMRRRVQRLVERLGSSPYQFVMRQLKDWPPMQRKVGESVFLRGLSQREASQQLGMPIHGVRREVERIQSIYDNHQQQQNALWIDNK